MNNQFENIVLKAKNLITLFKVSNIDEQSKKEFSIYFNKKALFMFRFMMIIYATASTPWFYFDYISAPIHYKSLWFLRFVFLVFFSAIGIWLSFKKFMIRNLQIVSNTLHTSYNLAILLMIYISEPSENSFNTYYIGLIVIISSAIALGIRLKQMIINFSIIVTLYVLIGLYKQNLDIYTLVSNLYYILTTILAVLLGGGLIEASQKKTFVQDKLLKKQADNLKERHIEIEEKNQELKVQNEEISSQRDEIYAQRNFLQEQKENLERINLDVSLSIDYARLIQESTLPIKNNLLDFFDDAFILYKPKDKVSGDFYWWAKMEHDNKLVLTVADCTGHGVPGAFMSLLGISFLREIVTKEYINHPGLILKKLRKEIISTLKQEDKSIAMKDGMDMSLINIDLDTYEMEYAGAYNPIYIIKHGELNIKNESRDVVKLYDNSKLNIQDSKLLYEIKPDKMPIAIYLRMDKFTTHKIKLEKGDRVYMFSDGYADQFGGEKRRKFKYKAFKELLLKNADKPMKEQKAILDKTLNEWQGDIEQIDDITVLGIKI